MSYGLAQLGEPHQRLKDEQERSIHAIYGEKDVFMILPTGFGKSVCYQVLPFVFDHQLGLVAGSSIIVVSPLIALMVYIGDQWTVPYARNPILSGIMVVD